MFWSALWPEVPEPQKTSLPPTRPSAVASDVRGASGSGQTRPLPEGMSPGVYTVEVGLYYPDAGRLPTRVNGVQEQEGRVRLATIEVVD